MEEETDKIPEALVCYRIVEGCLSAWDIDANKPITVNLDGAHFKSGGDDVFKGYEKFYSDHKWERIKRGNREWQGIFEKELDGKTYKIQVISNSKEPDIVMHKKNGPKVVIECKKGSQPNIKGNRELPLMRDAIGQLFLHQDFDDKNEHYIGLPKTVAYDRLVLEHCENQTLKNLNIRFLRVDDKCKLYSDG